MTPEDILVTSAQATVNAWNEPDESGADFAKLVQYSLDLDGGEMMPEIVSGERPGLFWPTEVLFDGKWRDGSVLFLPDRIVLAWRVGILRMKHFHRTVRHEDLSPPIAESHDYDKGRPRRVYTLGDRDGTTFRLWKFQGMLSPTMVEGLINGSITISVGDDEDS